MEKMTKAQAPTSFGIFSPTGHVVVAFDSDADAKKARQALVTGGITGDEITYYSSAEVLSQIEGKPRNGPTNFSSSGRKKKK